MTRYTLLLLLFCLSGQIKAQVVTANPPGPDYCQWQNVTYTFIPLYPNNTVNWYIDEYGASFSMVGIPFTIFAGTGTTLNVTPLQYTPGFQIRAEEVDSNGTLVWGSSLYSVYYEPSITIPVYYNNLGCGTLEAGYAFDGLVSQQRWSMWYRDGIATGSTSGFLYGPMPPGSYQYKLLLGCSTDTLESDPVIVGGFLEPLITASGPTTFCDGDSVVLTVQSFFNISSWRKNGVTIPGTAGLDSLKVTTTGNYHAVVYSPSGGGSCYQSSTPLTVTVNPAAIISGSTIACSSDTITLTCTPAGSYQWKRYGTNIPGATSQTLQVTLSGNYEVITTGLTCNTSDVHNVQFYARPSGIAISQSGPIPLCKNESMSLTVTGSNITSWSWLRNGISMPGSNTPTITVTKPGNYKCIVSNAIGCSKTSAVAKLNTPAAAELPSKSVTLKLNPSGSDSYVSCAFGSSGANFGNATTLEVSAWYKHFRTSEQGYLKFDFSSIPEHAPIVSATLKLFADTVAVYQNGVQSLFVERVTEGWLENTISWGISPDYSEFQRSSIPVTTAQSNSTISVSVTDLVRHWSFLPAENFGFKIHLEENTALGLPTGWMSFYSGDHPTSASRPKLTIKYAFADITENGPLTFCAGGSVIFSTNPGYNYQWYENNNAIPGANAANYTATTAGNYYVVLSNAAGCTVQSATKTVTVPCREGKFDADDIVIIHEQSSDEIKVILPVLEGSIMLYDITGRIISSYDCHERECVFVNSNLSSGVYMVRVVSAGAMRSKKVLIE